MKKLIALVEIPPCDRDYGSRRGVIIEEGSFKIGDRVYTGDYCHSSSETCEHCHSRELDGTIVELREYEGDGDVDRGVKKV